MPFQDLLPSRMGAAGIGLAALTAYLFTLAPTITWRHGGADSGDLAAAVATLGVAHPPGYPTYVLMGYLWTALPLGGDVAYRLNLFSAISAALAASLTVLTIAYLGRQLGSQLSSPNSLLLALGASSGGLFLAFAPIIWSQATIAEVYTPGLAMLALLSWLLFRWACRPQSRFLILAGLVAGLGFGVLPQIVLAAPGTLLMLMGQREATQRASYCLKQPILLLLLGIITGLMVFIYLPLRALAHPLVNWGDPVTPARFWAVVTAAQYHPYLGLLTLNEWLSRLGEGLAQLKLALSWSGLGLAGLGIYLLWQYQRAVVYYLLSLMGLTLLFRTSYPVMGNIVYLAPVVYSLALLAGLGMSWLLAKAQRQTGSLGAIGLGLGVVITLSLRAVMIAPQLDLSQADEAARFGQQVLAALPAAAVVVSDEDKTTFSLWYQQALGTRPDVAVIDSRLFTFRWYRDHLATRYPELVSSEGRLSTTRPICRLTLSSDQRLGDKAWRRLGDDHFTCNQQSILSGSSLINLLER